MKIKHLSIWLFLLFSTIVRFAFAQDSDAQNSAPRIIITEIGAFETADNEWFEIYNNGEAAVDLTGWKFFEDGTNHGLNPVSGSVDGANILEPATYAIIANKSVSFLEKYPYYSGHLFDSSWGSLKEEGEEIGLKNADGETVEMFTYPASVGETSLERVDYNISASELANWQNHPDSHSIGEGAVPVEEAPEEEEDLPEPEPETEPEPEPETEIPEEEEYLPEPEPEIPEEEEDLPEPETEPEPEPVPVPTPTPIFVPQPTPIPPPAPAPPANDPPTAVIEIQSGSLIAEKKTTVNFDGRASFDPNGDTLTYLWDMGDGTTEQTANPRPHSYKIPRTYKIILTVTDSSGAIGRATEIVEVRAKILQASNENFEQTQPAPKTKAKLKTKTEPKAESEAKPKAEAKPKVEEKPKAEANNPKIGILEMPEAMLTISGYFVFVPYDQNAVFTQKKNSGSKTKTKPGKYLDGDKSASIIISEIYPGPSSDDPAGEWIEIINRGESAVNLGNWGLADMAKKDSPYLIPDTVILGPGEYIVFSKTDTKISLNNGSDSVYLTDYEGNIIDSVAFEGGKPANAYALIEIVGERSTVDGYWEWIDQPTPGRQNPTFEKFEGVVTQLLENEAQMKLSDGSLKKIGFTQKTLDPLLAQVVMSEGTRVAVRAQQTENGQYELEKIEEVIPEQQEESTTQKSYLLWYVWGAILIIISAIALFFRRPLLALTRSLQQIL